MYKVVGIILIILDHASGIHSQPSSLPTDYNEGDKVEIQCKISGEEQWTSGPICHETGKELQFNFGIDSFRYCGLYVANETIYKEYVSLINLEKTWHCRVPMDPSKLSFVPFTLPLWGEIGTDSVRVNNRLNFLFHVNSGKIVGAAAYPVKDHFQYVRVDNLVPFHGAVKWFHQNTFQAEALGTSVTAIKGAEDWVMVLASSGVSCFLTLVFAAILYQRRLKPAIIRKCLKKE